jgi:hypothetical protein
METLHCGRCGMPWVEQVVPTSWTRGISTPSCNCHEDMTLEERLALVSPHRFVPVDEANGDPPCGVCWFPKSAPCHA